MNDSALYLEADEDITSAIDKLQRVKSSSVQIVVPKRSTMLQSVINLKLLKKAAEDAGKDLVLVTNDRIATDLAGRVGLAVAPSLGAKAVRAEMAQPAPAVAEDIIEEGDPEPPHADPEPVIEKPKAPAKRPLFARKAVSEGPPAPTELAAGAELGAANASTAGSSDTPAVEDKPAKAGGVKVPDFGRLQRRLLWVGLGVALIASYFVGMYFLSSAKVTLYAAGSKVDIDTNFSADPGLKQSDMNKAVLAAQAVTFSKDLTGSFASTGQKDAGTKAGGKMTISNATGADQPLVAGTQFAAADGKIFRSNEDIVVPKATLNADGDKVNGQATVQVTADQNGDTYNEAPGAYTIPKLGNPKITAQGAQMSGGTSKIMKVVTQADIDKAKTDLLAKDKDAVARDIDGRVPSGYVALADSQQQSADNVTSTPAADEEAANATISLKVTYTELAVVKKEYEQLIQAKEQTQIGDQNQIYDDGLTGAKVTVSDRDATGRVNFHIATQAYGGAKLDKTAIATQLKGRRYGDAATVAAGLPGVQRADINLWPAWSTNLPGRANKITIAIQVAGQDQAKSK